MKRKAWVFLLSFLLVVAIAVPGTIAFVSADKKQSTTQLQVGTSPEQETSPLTTVAEKPKQVAEISLFEQLMSCETLERFDAIIEAIDEAAIPAVIESLTPEQMAQLEAKLESLESVPLPPVVIDEVIDTPVESEIIYGTKNVDDVAPFLDPVIG